MQDLAENEESQASSDFSFGLTKEQSHLSSHGNITQPNESSTESPIKKSKVEQFKIKINKLDSSEKNDFFNLEDQKSEG